METDQETGSKHSTPIVDVKEEWLNMDTSEPEKLSWIGDLPPPPKPDDRKVKRICFNKDFYIQFYAQR